MNDSNYKKGYDVTIIGGGILGLTYANWVKKLRPESTIIVLEARKNPVHKIGESTLSATIRNLLDIGFSYDQLRKIFHVKEGVGFWWTDRKTKDLTTPVDVVHLDETFQFDRRVFENAFIKLSKRNGIEVIQGARVSDKSIEQTDNETSLSYTLEGHTKNLKTKIICDATGPRRLLAKKFGEGISSPETGFNSHSAYAYFKEKDTNFKESKWTRPMTRHICFEEGWMWFINLDDWTKNSDEQLDQFCASVIDANDQNYMSRKEIQLESNTTDEKIVSIGFVLKDKKFEEINRMSPEEVFNYFSEEYPAIKEVLSHYEILPEQYNGTTYFKRMNLPTRLNKFAGKGWLAVGEAAFLIDPLWSTGMTYGVGTSYMGAKQTVKALNNSKMSEIFFKRYHEYCDFVFENVYREIDMYYCAFEDRELFEKTILMKIVFALSDIVKKTSYTEDDPYVWGILTPIWKSVTEDVQDLFSERETASAERKQQIKSEILQRIDKFLENLKQDERFKNIPWGNYLPNFDHELKRDNDHQIADQDKDFDVVSCPECKKWHSVEVSACPICGVSKNLKPELLEISSTE